MADSADIPSPAAPSPLSGQTVLITRAAHQGDALAERIERSGGNVLRQPAIEIVGPESWAMTDAVIRSLTDYSRLVFVSSNAVTFFFNRVIEQDQLPNLKKLSPEIVTIGPGTSRAVEEFDLQVALTPESSNSQSLATTLIDHPTTANTVILRADRGSDVLSERLRDAGVDFEELPIYRSQDVREPDPEIFQQMTRGEIAWTTITSSAIGSSVVNLFGDALSLTKIATISPTTTAAMERLGFDVAAEASRYDLDGIVEAMESAS